MRIFCVTKTRISPILLHVTENRTVLFLNHSVHHNIYTTFPHTL